MPDHGLYFMRYYCPGQSGFLQTMQAPAFIETERLTYDVVWAWDATTGTLGKLRADSRCVAASSGEAT